MYAIIILLCFYKLFDMPFVWPLCYIYYVKFIYLTFQGHIQNLAVR